MGEIAEMMLDGEMCEGCGVYLGGEALGIPRKCQSCGGDAPEHPVYSMDPAQAGGDKTMFSCGTCSKMFRSKQAVSDHMRDKHGD